MTDAQPTVIAPFVESVFHPSDFSPASEAAFCHALAISLVRQTKLVLMHAGGGPVVEGEWQMFPGVRATLERWGLLEPGSARSEVFERFRVGVEKVRVRDGNPARAVLEEVEAAAPDLIVLATEGREGLQQWLKPSVAEKVAREARAMTLFVPVGSRGIVEPSDGSLRLRRVLLPVDHAPSPAATTAYVERLARLVGDTGVEVTLLHVGDRQPVVSEPAESVCRWRVECVEGDVVEAILEGAARHDVDLIAMTTEGRNGVLDALRGSVTERVLRGASCPLLAVPRS